MGNFVNRSTLAYVRSGNEPDYPDPPWLNVPPGSANETICLTVPQQYRKIAGDVLSEMSQAEKDAVDAATLDASRDSIADQLDEVESLERAFALVLLDEINTLRAQHSLAPRTIAQLKAALRGKLGS